MAIRMTARPTTCCLHSVVHAPLGCLDSDLPVIYCDINYPQQCMAQCVELKICHLHSSMSGKAHMRILQTLRLF